MTLDEIKKDMWKNSESVRFDEMVEYGIACDCLEEAYKTGASDMEKAKNIAINALLKQAKRFDPVKPIIGQYENGWDLYITCPTCNTDLGKPSMLKKYCRNCGQAFDWGNKE